jgi:hypothetical protein
VTVTWGFFLVDVVLVVEAFSRLQVTSQDL